MPSSPPSGKRQPGRREVMLGGAVLAGAAALLALPGAAPSAPTPSDPVPEGGAGLDGARLVPASLPVLPPGTATSGPAPRSLEIARLSWPEVRDAQERGWRTAIVPTGGLEQNGPHLAIGKHDRVVAWAALRIAGALGDALVAPVLSYVPEGDDSPPTGHMGAPGTMGVPEAVFEGVLEGIARSLRAGGFAQVCFLSDHGGSLAAQARVAERLGAEWGAAGPRVLAVGDYYSDAIETRYLLGAGAREAELGQHAGLADTCELLAVDPSGVDLARLPPTPEALARLGASGDPRGASAERGRALMALRVEAALRQIRAARAAS